MTEFPSNPLCKSPDLKRLRALADQFDFLLLVDETVGTFVNVNVLPYADMVMSSLTKLFSGDSNVMGGSIVVNPSSRYFSQLMQGFQSEYKDTFWCEDAVYLERNSRDFKKRSTIASANAERLADALKAHPKIKTVFYPKYTKPEVYNQCKRSDGAYGSLLSVVFHVSQHAIDFYDAIRCAKGPSLGTNFTLASPYVILAHYGELDWAELYGVDRHLVRISVGLEDFEQLLHVVISALE
jgi:cystathionine gamma-synthase